MIVSCVFCRIAAGEHEASTFLDDELVIGFMDIHPARPGHALVLPRRHAQFVHELHAAEAVALWDAGRRVAAALRAECDDVNFLINDGPHAGQTVPHAHLHLLPRRKGDLGRLMLRFGRKAMGGVNVPRSELDAWAARLKQRL